MSHNPKQGVIGSILNAASAVKKSPQMLRKAFQRTKKPMGVDKNYSSLNNCEENGWLHSDDKIVTGVPTKVKYLGSVEIQFVPNDPAENNRLAIETMRFLQSNNPESQEMVLTIAAGRVTLTSPDGSKILTRHSTSRIAYSTVDTNNKRFFCYVALSRRNATPLCHVFYTASPRASYELTFTCAQAFDYNFRQWQKNGGSAKMKAAASENGDIDPSNPRKSPLMSRKQLPTPTGRHSPLATTPKMASALPEISHTPSSLKHVDSPSHLGLPRQAEKWHPLDRVGDARQGEPVSPGMLDVEEDDPSEVDEFFSQLAAARSAPNMLDIGVEPEDFNMALQDDTAAQDGFSLIKFNFSYENILS